MNRSTILSYSLFLATLFCLSFARPSPPSNFTTVPVIGVISAPGSDDDDSDSYISLGAVEFVQAGGAKVIPIPWNIDDSGFYSLLSSVNGVLFTGGDAALWEEEKGSGRDKGRRKRKATDFQEKMNNLVDFVLEKKDEGIYYPLYAIGQGFESIGLSLTEDLFMLAPYNHPSDGTLGTVDFQSVAKSSKMFQYFTQASFDLLQNNETMYYWNEYGFNGSVPVAHPVFDIKKWLITAVSKDNKGQQFLAAMESRDYPIFMIAFHPEEVLYEANNHPTSTHLASTLYAVKMMAKAFITEAAKNQNQVDHRELHDSIAIENYEPVNYGMEGHFYVFDKNSFDGVAGISGSKAGWTAFGILILAVVGFFGYKKYKEKQQQKPVGDGFVKFVNDGVELREGEKVFI